MRYIVEKGSVTIDGVSLTVARVSEQHFAVSIIPHTGKSTILLDKKPSDIVNLEIDIIGKYIERFLSTLPANDTSKSKITYEFLANAGFI